MFIEDNDMPKIADATHKAVQKWIEEQQNYGILRWEGTPKIDERWPRLVRVMGDRFIVVFEVYISLPPLYPEDTEHYTLEQVHVVFHVIWKDRKRFLRVVDVHEDANHDPYNERHTKFYCSMCPTDMMKGRK